MFTVLLLFEKKKRLSINKKLQIYAVSHESALSHFWLSAFEANLRAVSDDEERVSVDHEGLDVVGFADFQDVNVLDLDELAGGGVVLVNVRAPEQLGHNDEEVAVNQHGLADDSGGA